MSGRPLDFDESDDAEQRCRTEAMTGVPGVSGGPIGSDASADSAGSVGVGVVDEPGGVERIGAVARELFGSTLPVALRYAELLACDGVTHGHIGPRELPRLWSRHLVNCAVVSDLLPSDAALVDVGSGAGLPGLPIAIRRADLSVTLVEAMQRRAEFLTRCVDELGLGDRVSVVRGRVDDPMVMRSLGRQRWMTARAVAPLDRLVRWCIPLLEQSGELLAMKGERASDEVERDASAVGRLGGEVRSVLELHAGEAVTRVVVVGRQDGSSSRRDGARGRRPAAGVRQSERRGG